MSNVIPLRRGRATDIEREAIAHMWTLGYSYDEIARAQGRGIPYTKKIIHGELGRQEPNYPPDMLEEAKNLYEVHRYTQGQVAEARDFPHGSAAYVLGKAGVRMRRTGWLQKTDAKWLRIQKNAAEG